MAQVLQFGQRNRPELKTGKGLNQGCQKIQKSVVGNKETKHLQVDWPFAKNWVESKNITEKHTISFRSMGGWLGWKCGISQKLSNILTPLTSLGWSQQWLNYEQKQFKIKILITRASFSFVLFILALAYVTDTFPLVAAWFIQSTISLSALIVIGAFEWLRSCSLGRGTGQN